ncbi:Protein of unknown function [Lactobacillus helveticus CIRM-BIA 101]|nr:Protein of unknown function [Lactobacillus helveticus CIRM-BIA 101]
MKSELAEDDQVKSQESEFPRVSLDDDKKNLFED